MTLHFVPDIWEASLECSGAKGEFYGNSIMERNFIALCSGGR